jgi:CheY-like chemotaxis protein
MACLPTILCLGEDPDLLGTRAMLLERLGAEVKRATSIAEALEQVASENFDLIVLCHSLKQSDAVAICDVIRERKPPPFIVKITNSFGFEEERAQILCDAIVDAHPGTLTECAKELLLRKSVARKFPRSELRFDDARTNTAHH